MPKPAILRPTKAERTHDIQASLREIDGAIKGLDGGAARRALETLRRKLSVLLCQI
jgi:hypothetical protein